MKLQYFHKSYYIMVCNNSVVFSAADKEAGTKGEKQTPVHYAAKNDACLSLKVLIKAQCRYKTVRDYKGRTPLHLAAELGIITQLYMYLTLLPFLKTYLFTHLIHMI